MSTFFSWPSLKDPSGPSVAVEIAAHRVSAAGIEWRGGQPVIAAHAIEPLPDGALVPSLTSHNAHDRAAVLGALDRVFERVGRPRRVGLVVPDLVAKVSLVRFEQVPPRAQDLEQLVRWQVKKTAPFAIDDAQVSYVPGIRTADGQEFLVSLARRDVIEEYEGLCLEAGAHAGIVDLATFNVINAVLAGSMPPSADWLLVNVAADYASIALLRGPHVIFFRNRGAETDGSLEDLVHQTAMYYQDRLAGQRFSRVFLGGTGRALGAVDTARRNLEERLGAASIESIDPTRAAALTDRILVTPDVMDVLGPLIGMALRTRKEAVTA